MTTTQDLGPLDWAVPIVLPNGRPTPEFQRKWQAQRVNNNLIGLSSFGAGAPTASAGSNGNVYYNQSTTPYTLYTSYNGSWVKVGASRFTDLLDAPHAYTSSGGYIVQVNSGANALQFTSLTSLLDTFGSTQGTILYRGASSWQALAPGTATQVLQLVGTPPVPTWQASGGGGGGAVKWTIALQNVSAGGAYSGSGGSGTAVTPWSTSYTASGKDVLVQVGISAYALAVGVYNYYLLRNGTIAATGSFFYNATSTHLVLPTISAKFAAETGTNTYSVNIGTNSNLNLDTNDFCQMLISENT